MISLGTSSAYLQNQIISGFDSVAQGFTATATTISAAGLQTALDSFSSFDTSETTNLAAMGSQQQISGVAEFSSPAAYLNNQLVDSEIRANDPVLRAFQDPSLGSGNDLSGISEILSAITSQADPLAKSALIGPPNSDPLAKSALVGPPNSDPFAKAAIVGPPNNDPFANVTAIGPPNSDPFAKAAAIGPPNSDPFAKAAIIGPPNNDPFANVTAIGPPNSDPFATLTRMSATVREAASLFQNVNVSMLSRRITG